MVPEGTEIAGFRITSLVARAEFVDIVRAVQLDGGRDVFVEIMKTELARDRAMRSRFERNAEFIRRLGHPNVLPVLDLGEHDGRPYLVTRYFEGNLGDLVERQEGLAI